MEPGDVEEGLAASDSIGGFGGSLGSVGKRKLAGAEDERAREVGVEVPVGDDRAFGRPVVPEVNRIVAASSSSIGVSGSSAPGA